MDNHFDVVIIGGGASGLMCALTAGRRGRHVLIVDRSPRVGSKILMSGGGRCNFTNRFIGPDRYVSANPHFCISALNRYTQQDFIAMVEKHGISFHERDHGRLFCDRSAKDVLEMLLTECAQAKVRIQTRCGITAVEAVQAPNSGPDRFKLTTDQGRFSATSLVVATGGLSIPGIGASGFGYDIASQFGMHVLPTRPGLVPFTFSGVLKAVSERLSGISLEVALSCASRTFRENALFTHRGLSGPAALQLSSYWRTGECIEMDVLPGIDAAQWLASQKQDHPRSLLRNLLAQCLPKRLVLELQAIFWQPWADQPIGGLPDAVLHQVSEGLSRWRLKPSGTEGYRTAEVTLGGVDTGELSSRTMESRTRPGLYFIGEVVDVAGHLGGFNLQWAWSSGAAAGQFV
jgi:hypothetical protein